MIESNFENPMEGMQTREPIRLKRGQRTVLNHIYEGSTVSVFFHPQLRRGLVLLSKDPESICGPKAVLRDNPDNIQGKELGIHDPVIFKEGQVVVVHHPKSEEVIKVRLIDDKQSVDIYMQLGFERQAVLKT